MGRKKVVGSNDVTGRSTSRNPDFIKILDDCKRLHEIKSHDYAADDNVFSNFEYAAKVAEPFNGVHKVFATLMGVKMARLSELLKGKIPKNESVYDSDVDRTNYSAIWGSYTMKEMRRIEELAILYPPPAIKWEEAWEKAKNVKAKRRVTKKTRGRRGKGNPFEGSYLS